MSVILVHILEQNNFLNYLKTKIIVACMCSDKSYLILAHEFDWQAALHLVNRQREETDKDKKRQIQ